MQARATEGFAVISLIFILIAVPLDRLAAHESTVVSRKSDWWLAELISCSTPDWRYTEYPHENNCADEVPSEP